MILLLHEQVEVPKTRTFDWSPPWNNSYLPAFVPPSHRLERFSDMYPRRSDIGWAPRTRNFPSNSPPYVGTSVISEIIYAVMSLMHTGYVCPYTVTYIHTWNGHHAHGCPVNTASSRGTTLYRNFFSNETSRGYARTFLERRFHFAPNPPPPLKPAQ